MWLQGVIPKYGDMLDEMTTGTCVALEVSEKGHIQPFRSISHHILFFFWEGGRLCTLLANIKPSTNKRSLRVEVLC